MELRLKRSFKADGATIGLLYADGTDGNSILRVFTLEDPERLVKIKGETAIPRGRYRLIKTWSPRFNRKMWLLENVPGYEGIRFHAGTRQEHTEGCIMPALIREGNRTRMSQVALEAVEYLLDKAAEAGEENYITITSILSYV
jgi:hypothetical protein